MTQTEFNLKYSKPFTFLGAKASDTFFFWVLSASFTIVILIIIWLANMQFGNLDEHIKKQYLDFALSLKPELFISKPTAVRQQNRFISSKKQIDTKKFNSTDSVSQVNKNRSAINIGGIQIEELSYEGEANLVERPSLRTKRSQINLDSLLDDRSMYKIKREAVLYIKAPAGQSAEKIKYGYRNQEEVYRIIETKSMNIESCFEKAARFGMVKSGYVKIEFKITSDGFILPQSIRIIASTLRNKSVEQCIKKNIRQLRGFEKLDKNRGIARVTHKFVFH